MDELIESIKSTKGLCLSLIPDPIHGWKVPSFGHGLTYLTAAESEMILRNRVASIIEWLGKRKPVFKTLTQDRQNASNRNGVPVGGCWC